VTGPTTTGPTTTGPTTTGPTTAASSPAAQPLVCRPNRRSARARQAASPRRDRRYSSGTSQMPASGGSVSSAETVWPCQGIGSGSTAPRFPTSVPP
jgi:hypothetical protein